MNLLGVLPHPQFGPWEIGPAEIHGFGLAVAIGLIIGLTLAGRRGRKILGVREDRIHNFAIWMIIFGWCFSHIYAVVLYSPDQVMENPLILFQFWGEISSVGGIIGAGIAFLIWAYRNPDEDHLGWFDVALWSLPIGFFFGRVGCMLAFDHPGKEVSEFGLWNWVYDVTGGAVPELFPLAMQFPEQWGGGIRHNLGFYEAILWLAIIVVFVVLGRKPRRRGLYAWLLPLLYAPGRFMLDFLRAMPDEVSFGGDPRYWGLTPAQYTAIGFLIIGIYGWYKWRNKPVDTWAIHEGQEGKGGKSAQSNEAEE